MLRWSKRLLILPLSIQVAVFDTGLGPTVSFNAEYDALKGIGHACGHNLIAVASVAGALATAMVMEKHGITGRIMLVGTPAEGMSCERALWPIQAERNNKRVAAAKFDS